MAIEPKKIRAGDSVAWTVSNSTYKATDGWSLAFVLVGAKGAIASVAAVPDGDDFDCALTAVQTKGLSKGQYRLVERVSKDLEAITIYDGRVEVLANLMAATGEVDDRAHAELVLEAIEATILGRAATDQENMTVNGQMLGRTPIPDLAKLRQLYRREVNAMKNAESMAAGLGNKNKIRVRFR